MLPLGDEEPTRTTPIVNWMLIAVCFIIFLWQIIRVPAYLMLGLWFLYQLFLAMMPFNLGVAYWAHVGGFIAGLAMAKIFGAPRRHRVYYLYY